MNDRTEKAASLRSPALKEKWSRTSSTVLDVFDENEKPSNEKHEKAKGVVDRRQFFKQMRQESSSSWQPENNGGQQITPSITIPQALLDVSRHTTAYSVGTAAEEEDDQAKSEFSMGDPLHEDILLIGRWRNRVGAFINCRICQCILMGMIIINAGILGALTFLYDNPGASRVLEIIDYTFLGVFTLETSLQGFYLGPVRYLRNLWLLWDLIIIILSWAFLSFPSISVMRSFRIFRIFVLFSRSESMRVLVKAVGRTLPKMASIWVALLLFFYTFCVLFTDLYHGLYDNNYLDYDYFGRLDRTFLTLFQFMTLDSWSNVVRQVQEARPAALIGFCIWIIITAFFVMNLMVAVICESLIEINNMRDKKRQNKMLKQQRNLISAQTEELLEETHEVVKLQKEMLANQVIMQQLLVQIATQMSQQNNPQTSLAPPDQNNAEQVVGGKGALARLMTDVADESDDENVHSEEPPRSTED